MLPVYNWIFCTDASSTRGLGSFFSVAITTPFVAADTNLQLDIRGLAHTAWDADVHTLNAQTGFAALHRSECVFDL